MTLTDHSKNMNTIDINEVAENIRKTNYRLGSDDVNYLSQAKNTYVHHRTWEKVALSEDKKNTLRKHNFVLGYTDYEKSSEYKN